MVQTCQPGEQTGFCANEDTLHRTNGLGVGNEDNGDVDGPKEQTGLYFFLTEFSVRSALQSLDRSF